MLNQTMLFLVSIVSFYIIKLTNLWKKLGLHNFFCRIGYIFLYGNVLFFSLLAD